MASLIYLDTDNVMHNLAYRYARDEIYTNITKVRSCSVLVSSALQIVIAVNPYQNLDLYSKKAITLYRRDGNKRNNKLAPHVFAVSTAGNIQLIAFADLPSTAYYTMLATQTNQSMIVCGESGSGKTESAKQLMRFLAFTADDEDGTDKKTSIEKQVCLVCLGGAHLLSAGY